MMNPKIPPQSPASCTSVLLQRKLPRNVSASVAVSAHVALLCLCLLATNTVPVSGTGSHSLNANLNSRNQSQRRHQRTHPQHIKINMATDNHESSSSSSASSSLRHVLQTKTQSQAQRQLQTETGWVLLGQAIEGQAANDQSGTDVAISDNGSRIAVSAPLFDGTAGANTGIVTVYDLVTAANGVQTWTPVGTPIQGPSGAEQGRYMSLSGDGTTLALGTTKLSPYKGNVRIFRYITNQWTMLKQIDGTHDGDRFGNSVSLSYDGTRVAIGAPFHDFSVGDYRGQTQIWEQDAANANTWTLIGDIKGDTAGDRSGHSVALSGNGDTVAIGEITADPAANLQNAGTVAIWKLTSTLTGWTRLGTDIPGVLLGDQSGSDVAISYDGTIVAIGSPLHSSQASRAGMARVYEFDAANSQWTQLGSNLLPTAPLISTKFGWSVSLSSDGSILAVGEPTDSGIGKTSIFQYQYNSQTNTGTWDLAARLQEGANTDRFGGAVALSGDGTHVIVGSLMADSGNLADRGITRVYQFQTNDWSLTVSDFQTAFGTGTNPEFSITFQGAAPTAAAGRTYRLSMSLPGCALGPASDTAVAPVTPAGPVANAETFSLVAQLRVNTNTITTSGYFVDKGAGMGELAFCLGMEVLEGSNVKVERFADIAVQLDMGQGFVMTNFVSRDVAPGKTDIRESVQFNYGLTTYFCDASGTNIQGGSSSSVPPGGEVSVCLEAVSGEGVQVSDLRDVSFGNNLAPLVGVELVDSSGSVLLSTTTKSCASGKCRIAALTIPRLYEYVDDSGNVQNVAAGVTMEGTVLFSFARRNRRLQGGAGSSSSSMAQSNSAESLEARFSIQLDLASPPDRSKESQQSASCTTPYSLTVAIAVMLVLACLF